MSLERTNSWRDAQSELERDATKARINDLSDQIKLWRDRYAEAERVLGVALDIKKGGRALKPVEPLKTKASESVAVFVASDWHVEEPVESAAVNGRNEFNLQIAEKRIVAFFRNALRLAEIQRSGTDIDTCVLALLGDFMSGYIHEELVESNLLSPTETILWVMPRINAGIALLKKNFKRVLIPCSIGNHGRTTQRMRFSTGYKNSFEWLMYHVMMQNSSGVEFSIPQGYHNLLDMYGYTLRFHHGDAIRYGGGVGGLAIPVNKAIAQWNRGGAVYLDIFGHWHQRLDGGSFISNSSLIGYNAFALQIKAAPEPPTQSFVLIEKKHGKTITAPIWLDQ
jgi:hypothetical protein